MITIKDVAKLAGVSHGTVSNILNGVKGVNLEKVKRVEAAIKELGYKPDAKARSLKTNKTMHIGIILPNITDSSFSQLFTGIERMLSENQYAASLYITSEIAANEKKILNHIQSQRLDGVIVATCQPQNTELFNQIKKSGIKFVFVEREIESGDFNFVGADFRNLIYNATNDLVLNGCSTISIVTGPEEYSCEKQCIEGYIDALKKNNILVNKKLIETTDLNKESAFKATFRLIQLGEIPDAIITSSPQLAEGVLKAIAICEGSLIKNPLIISLSEDSWTNINYPNIIKLPRQYMRMGEMAAEILLENIDKSDFFDTRRVVLENANVDIDLNFLNSKTNKRTNSRDKLKVLMLDSSASYATFSLLADFRSSEGIVVDIDTLTYSELYEVIKDESLKSEYDVFEIDIPWLPEMAEKGKLADLNQYIKKNPDVIADLIPGILDEYAKYDEKFFVLPYMYGTQILYYRKDIFENKKYQRLFYEAYRSELKAPKTWTEYNAIAKFFTKEYNPESPTKYGTTLGGQFFSGAVCEFLPREWSFGGKSFDENGNVVLNSRETIKALNNYCESFKYASPMSCNHWWYEQVEEFCQGDAAMMVLFMSHATDITDRYKSKVVGKIGFDTIPGGTPLLGGWSLGINQNSRKKDSAFKFISWACCKDLAIPYTILGGSTPCVNLYKSPELVSIYPWLPKSLESFNYSRKRQLPKAADGSVISERQYEEILGEAVHNAITNQLSVEEAVRIAAEKLQGLK